MLRRNPDPPAPKAGATQEDARAARVDDGVRRLAQTHNQAVTATAGVSGVGRKPS